MKTAARLRLTTNSSLRWSPSSRKDTKACGRRWRAGWRRWRRLGCRAATRRRGRSGEVLSRFRRARSPRLAAEKDEGEVRGVRTDAREREEGITGSRKVFTHRERKNRAAATERLRRAISRAWRRVLKRNERGKTRRGLGYLWWRGRDKISFENGPGSISGSMQDSSRVCFGG